MYHGGNPTALQSQQWLVEAMTELMLEKPFIQITVRDLCRKADLSRQTFYNFFPDKEALLRFCLERGYREEFAKLSGREELTVRDVLGAFFFVVTANRPLLTAMIRDGMDGVLADEILKCVLLFAGRFVRREKQKATLPYSAVMLSGALSQLMVQWVRQPEPLPREALEELLEDFFAGRLYEI